MSLKDKLARLDKSHCRTAGRRETGKPPSDLSRLMPGRQIKNSAGSFWRTRCEFPLTHRHGRFAVAGLLETNLTGLNYIAKDMELPPIAPDRLLFFDTETTGLSGGVGTFAFIIGVGYFEPGRFVVDQFFLRGFDDEPGMLRELATLLEQRVEQDGALISFNGKSYDLPLVHNRAVLQRVTPFPGGFNHLDLLYTARRLWKNHLSGCSLQNLESALLGVKRTGDIASHLIPETYFRYLRTADPRPLAPVFYHNRLDILSMVTLLTLMLELFESDQGTDIVPLDRLAVGRLLEALDETAKAQALYAGGVAAAGTDEERRQMLLRLAHLYKKKKEYHRACRLWEKAIRGRGFCLEPYVELAKTFEHHIRDLQRAQAYTRRALENISILERIGGPGGCAAARQGLIRRLQRIERKLRRKTNGQAS